MADKAELVSIASTGLSAQVDPLGAQLFALRDSHSQDLLWNGDPAIWASRAPILFPIVGELNQGVYRLDGQIFHLPRHGLARRRRFELVDAAASSACFRLSADGETWGVYPFDFVLDVEFAPEPPPTPLSAGRHMYRHAALFVGGLSIFLSR